MTTRRASHDVAPRRELGPNDGREETATRIGTRTGTAKRKGIGARMETKTETKEKSRGDVREGARTYEVLEGLGRKTRSRGWRQRVTTSHKGPTSQHNCSKRSIKAQGWEARDENGDGRERAKKRKNLLKSD